MKIFYNVIAFIIGVSVMLLSAASVYLAYAILIFEGDVIKFLIILFIIAVIAIIGIIIIAVIAKLINKHEDRLD